MNARPTLLRVAAIGALLTAACGGTATPASIASPTAAATTAAATTAAPTTAAPTVAAPSPTASPVPAAPHAGVGAAVAKLSESKLVASGSPAHVSFIGDEPSLGAGSYQELLNLVTLQPGGRTVSHKHGGVEWVIVVEGTVEVRMPGGKKATLTVGQTGKVPANTAVQAVNTGAGVARFLAFFVTANGQPFQTNLDTVP